MILLGVAFGFALCILLAWTFGRPPKSVYGRDDVYTVRFLPRNGEYEARSQAYPMLYGQNKDPTMALVRLIINILEEERYG